jgi:RNA polymerase sigma-70 factor (ECF subfamily)
MTEPSAPSGSLRRTFDICADGLYRFILVRTGGDRDAADELLQQACLEAARSRRRLLDDAERESFLFGIARNLVRKHWRRMKRRGVSLPNHDGELGSRLASQLEAGPIAPEVLARGEAVTQLMLAITALPSADQHLVFAHYFDGRSHVEIAAEMSSTTKSIESRLYRIRTRLRAMLRGKQRGES